MKFVSIIYYINYFFKIIISNIIYQSIQILLININEFLSIIDVRYIYYSIIYHKRYIKSFIVIINEVYYYYELFVYLLLLIIILRSDFLVIKVLDKDATNMVFLNYYGRKIDKYEFYYLYFNLVKQKKPSRFFFVNKVKCSNMLRLSTYYRSIHSG